MQVPLSRPDISPADRDSVMDVLSGPQLSMGPYTKKFEQLLAKLSGNAYGIAVNSGTSGLHLALKAMGIGRGDEVITTPFSFVASSNVMFFEGAAPRFVDIDEDTLDLSVEQIPASIGQSTAAILPVDVFGQPANLAAIKKISEQHGLKIIEDGCESLGATHLGKPVGHPDYCDAAVYAFYPNKQITTGEGGLIVTSDEHVAKLCVSMRNQGRGDGDHWLLHERLGYNYRMDEMSAALGYSQALRLDEIMGLRENVAERYSALFSAVDGVRTPYIAKETTLMSWFVYVVRFDSRIDRDALMQWLMSEGVSCRPYFTPIHLQPFYRAEFGYREGDFPVTEKVSRSTLALPFFNRLSDEEISYVVDRVKAGIERFGQ